MNLFRFRPGHIFFFDRNPGGVRFGSSEIYDVLEQDFAESLPDIDHGHVVHDALVIGQSIQNGADERVVLFVKLGDGVRLSDDLQKAIRTQIRAKRSPRHVPEKASVCPLLQMTVEPKHCELDYTSHRHSLYAER